MTYGGYGGGPTGPFGNDPFTGQGGGFPPVGPPGYPGGPPGYGPPGYGPPGYGPPPGPQSGQTNALATLSIVFGIIFAPVGAVLGHVALSQIKKTGEKGRERALIGLTVSYLMIFVAVIALVVFLVLHKNDSSSNTTITTTSKTTTPRTTTKRSTPRSTPAPPPVPQTVSVDDLRVGDCVRVEEHGNDPDNPNATAITITLVPCTPGPDVYHVDQVSKVKGTCPGDTLYNSSETTFVCVSQTKG